MKNINLTASFFILGFCVTMFVAFYFLPTPSVATKEKAKEAQQKNINPSDQVETIYLVVFTEQGRVESVFTERKKAEMFIEKTRNESIYEVKALNYIRNK